MEGAMELRAATPDDITWLTDTYIAAMRGAITEQRGHWDHQKEHHQFLQQLRLADTFVMLLEGCRAGFSTIWAEADHLFLGTLCVTPELQNRGVGKSAMRAVANRAGDLPVHLSVLKSNGAARRFYERMGCCMISTSQHHDHLVWPSPALNKLKG
jgi:ribosomal protein S18 acetylase RimI-like enzyme